MKLLILFIVLNVVNVIIQTVKSLATVKCGKGMASIVNAVAYGLYTIVLVYTMCDLPLYLKALVVALCNLVGVFIVKWLEEKARKDRLWKVEVTVRSSKAEEFSVALNSLNIPYSFIDIDKYYIFNMYCATQKDSALVRNIIDKFNAKYFVTESKTL